MPTLLKAGILLSHLSAVNKTNTLVNWITFLDDLTCTEEEYVYVITPFGVDAPSGVGLINTTTKGVIKCLLPLIGRCGAPGARFQIRQCT